MNASHETRQPAGPPPRNGGLFVRLSRRFGIPPATPPPRAAERLGKLLHLRAPRRDGWLIVGAHELAARIAEAVCAECGIVAVLVDTNARNVLRARQAGLRAWHADALEMELLREWKQLDKIGNLLALTDNPELNRQLVDRWAGEFGTQNVFGWFAGGRPSRSVPRSGVFDSALCPGVVSRELRDGVARIRVMMGYNAEVAKLAGIEVLAVLGRHQVQFYSDDMVTSSRALTLLVLHRHRGLPPASAPRRA